MNFFYLKIIIIISEFKYIKLILMLLSSGLTIFNFLNKKYLKYNKYLIKNINKLILFIITFIFLASY